MSKLQSYFKQVSDSTSVSSSKEIELEINKLEMVSKEVELISEDLESLEDVNIGLTRIATSMEVALADSGLGSQAYVFTQHAIGSYTNRLGIDSNSLTPSLESFEYNEKASVEASLEGIGDTLAAIWNAIKKAALAVYKAIRNFFSNLFGNTTESLLEKSDEIEKLLDDTLKDLYKNVKGLKIPVKAPEVLKYKGSVDEKSVLEGIKNTLTITKELREEFITNAVDVTGKYGDYIKNVKNKNSQALAGNLKELEQSIVESMGLFNKHSKTVISGDVRLDYGEKTNIFNNTPVIIPASKTKSFKSGVATVVFSPDALATIRNNCDEILSYLANSKSDVTRMLDNYDLAIRELDDLYTKAKKDDELAIILKEQKTQYLFKGIRKPTIRFCTKLDNHLTKVIKEALDFVDAHIKLYAAGNI